MTSHMSHEADIPPSPEHGRDLAAQAFKKNIGTLLKEFGPEIETGDHGVAGGILALQLISIDPETRLGKGLAITTDISIGQDEEAVYQSGQPVLSYGSNSLGCLLAEERLPGNINVKTLNWQYHARHVWRVEEVFSGTSLRAVMRGQHGLIARIEEARRYGLSQEDILLSNGPVGPEKINEIFSNVLSPNVLEYMKAANYF